MGWVKFTPPPHTHTISSATRGLKVSVAAILVINKTKLFTKKYSSLVKWQYHNYSSIGGCQ